MNLNTRQLRAFLGVARLRSFTRAAQQMHMTQAGLSGMIRELESQFGEKLFERTTRAVTLTTAGAALLPMAADVLEKLDSMAQVVGTIGSAARRSLTVATTPMLSATAMPRVFEEFGRIHPETALKVLDLDRLHIQGHVESGRIDAGFGVFLSTASGIQREKIATLPLLLAGPQTAAVPERISWKALRTMPIVALSLENPVQQAIEDQLARSGRAPVECPRFNSFTTLLAMVEAGLGCAIVPSFARLSNYRVRYARLTSPRVNLGFYQITKKGRESHPALADLSRMLTDVLMRISGDV